MSAVATTTAPTRADVPGVEAPSAAVPRRLPRPALLAAYAVFPLLMLVFVARYTKPYPVWETWYFVEAWAQLADGAPWWRTLFTPRWGHIHALPNGVQLLLGGLTCHSMLAGTVLTWAVAVAALVLVARQLPRSALLALGVTSAWFTPRLAEVWVNSWNLMWSLSLLQAAVIGSCLARPPTWRRLALAVTTGLLAVLTAGQGLAVVAAATLPLALHARGDRRFVRHLLVWVAFTALCVLLFKRLAGGGAGWQNLPGVDPAHGLALLAYALGDGNGFVAAFALVAGLVVGHALGARPIGRVVPSDVFWLYLVSFLLVFVVLLSLSRTGHLLARYLMVLWIGPAALVYLLWRVTGRRRGARAALAAACIAWLALNVQQGLAHARLVEGWEPLSGPLVALARADPGALEAGMFKGVSSDDTAVVVQALTVMRRLHTNVFCRR